LLDGVRASLLAVRDRVVGVHMELERKRKPDAPPLPEAFELFGFDFALDDAWKPWLLEANTTPDMLRQCSNAEIKGWSEHATESMIKMALAYRSKRLQIPKPSELEARSAGGSCCRVRRLFAEDDCAESPRHCGSCCYGSVVAKVPKCLVSGLDLGDPCGGWLLAMREKSTSAEAIWKSYEAQERALGSSFEDNIAHTRVLREWLLPMPLPPEPVSKKKKKASTTQLACTAAPSGGSTLQHAGFVAATTLSLSLPAGSRTMRSSRSLPAIRGRGFGKGSKD